MKKENIFCAKSVYLTFYKRINEEEEEKNYKTQTKLYNQSSIVDSRKREYFEKILSFNNEKKRLIYQLKNNNNNKECVILYNELPFTFHSPISSPLGFTQQRKVAINWGYGGGGRPTEARTFVCANRHETMGIGRAIGQVAYIHTTHTGQISVLPCELHIQTAACV